MENNGCFNLNFSKYPYEIYCKKGFKVWDVCARGLNLFTF